MIYPIIIGLITSIVSFVFNTVVNQLIYIVLDVNNYFFDALYFPLIGGVMLGLMNKYIITTNRAFEVVAIEEEITHIEEHLLEFKSVLLKMVASILSLVFGFSLGKQGTIVYLGGAIGSYFGYHMNQSTEDIKTMIGCGVSGMISGIFGMPLLGIVLVNEVIIKERQLKRTIYISLTAIITFLVNQYIFKVEPFVNLFKTSDLLSQMDLYQLIVFGIFAGGIALLYNASIKKLPKSFLNKRPFLMPVIVGGFITSLGLKSQWIYSMHFDSLEFLYFEEQISFLLIFIFMKILITGMSYNFGGYGGVFLPGIVIGAVLGRIFYLLSGYANGSTSMIIGITGIFAGFSGGPIAGIVLGFSLSGYDLSLLLPMSIVSFISYYIVKKSKMGFLY